MELLTRTQAADILRIGLRTLDRRIASGEIQCHRLGDGPRAPVRISPAQIDAYLAKTLTSDRNTLHREAAGIYCKP